MRLCSSECSRSSHFRQPYICWNFDGRQSTFYYYTTPTCYGKGCAASSDLGETLWRDWLITKLGVFRLRPLSGSSNHAMVPQNFSKGSPHSRKSNQGMSKRGFTLEILRDEEINNAVIKECCHLFNTQYAIWNDVAASKSCGILKGGKPDRWMID